MSNEPVVTASAARLRTPNEKLSAGKLGCASRGILFSDKLDIKGVATLQNVAPGVTVDVKVGLTPA